MTNQIAAGNWLQFRNFIPHNLADKEITHYLWEYANNVNSPILGESNGAQIKKILERVGAEFEMTTTRGALRGTEHYAVLVRVADDQGQPIKKVVDAIKEIKQDLEDYPILDDEDYSQRTEEANHALLVQELKYNSANWSYPDTDLDQLAWDVLSITQENESHDEGWFPEFDGEVGKALEQLGFSRVQEEE